LLWDTGTGVQEENGLVFRAVAEAKKRALGQVLCGGLGARVAGAIALGRGGVGVDADQAVGREPRDGDLDVEAAGEVSRDLGVGLGVCRQSRKRRLGVSSPSSASSSGREVKGSHGWDGRLPGDGRLGGRRRLARDSSSGRYSRGTGRRAAPMGVFDVSPCSSGLRVTEPGDQVAGGLSGPGVVVSVVVDLETGGRKSKKL
jgi:hypothetical protein